MEKGLPPLTSRERKSVTRIHVRPSKATNMKLTSNINMKLTSNQKERRRTNKTRKEMRSTDDWMGSTTERWSRRRRSQLESRVSVR